MGLRVNLHLSVICAIFLSFVFSIFVAHGALASERRDTVDPSQERTDPVPVQIIDGTPRPTGDTMPPVRATVGGRATRGQALPKKPDGPARSLQYVIGEAGMASDLGGDDVHIVSTTLELSPFIQIASDGTIFVAVFADDDVGVDRIDLWRSTDGGDVWALWSTYIDTGGAFFLADFVIAEGDADRVFLAYSKRGPPTEIKVAYANIAAASPITWTVNTVLSYTGSADLSALREVSIATDATSFSDYYVYLVSTATDFDGADVWFARSTTQGTSWAAAYKIADNTAGVSTAYTTPYVAYGTDNYVHTIFGLWETSTENGMLYRRAPNWANGNETNWDPPQTLNALDDGITARIYGFDAAPPDSIVLLSVSFTMFSSTATSPTAWVSTDNGVSWPPANQTFIADLGAANASPTSVGPAGQLVLGGVHNTISGPIGWRLVRSTVSNPTTWSAAETFTGHDGTSAFNRDAMAVDPTRGDRWAVVWAYFDGANHHVRFDAEWRRDPGYANTDIGFPVAVTGGGRTPPAIAEVDGDPFGEIVFASEISGDIFVYNHDGTVVPGWPQSIGAMAFDSPVAVGELEPNRGPAIVAGNAAGFVHAFAADGTIMPGFPVDMGTNAPVYCSIGALGPPNLRYVVAVSGHKQHVYRHDGFEMAVSFSFSDSISRPAAIGDIDNDGVTEVVTLKGEWYHATVLGMAAPKYFRWFFGENFSDAPTLADFDGDGDLEIAAPTSSGKMYLLNHDGSDYSVDWPVTVSPGVALTAAALANALGNGQIEMAFADATGIVHLLFLNGLSQAAYPKAIGGGVTLMPPIMDGVEFFNPHVIMGGTDGLAYSWHGLGTVSAGWPRNMSTGIVETLASGDIDNDGRNEIVVLGGDLTVLDVGSPPASIVNGRWPMYGFDAQRTGCLNCTEDLVTGIDDELPQVTSLGLTVHPNPFNPVTTLSYEITKPGPVTLAIYDVSGRVVAMLIDNEDHIPGRYMAVYQPVTASGIYFSRLESGGEVVTRKMVLMK